MRTRHSSYVSRRAFLQLTGAAAATAAVPSACARTLTTPELREARFYEPADGLSVRCNLCPWHCVVADGERGLCGVRENRKGRYFSLVYGRPCAINNDPIEKKPFFHVYPGSKALSIATVGCNMHCKFCQNWDISQADPSNVNVPFLAPSEIVAKALAAKSRAIAYTYSEPTIFFEYMADCARAAQEAELANLVVSNGFITAEPLAELCKLVTAIKIDLKAFTQHFYADVCEGRLQPVLDTLKRIKAAGVWLEVVVLILPTLNDGPEELKRLSDWVVTQLGPDVPLHFTRFHPAYKVRNLPSTPPRTLHRARRIAMEQGCHFVYTGNMPGGEGDHTYCPACGTCVLRRYGNFVLSNDLAHGKCHKCGTDIPGVWA